MLSCMRNRELQVVDVGTTPMNLIDNKYTIVRRLGGKWETFEKMVFLVMDRESAYQVLKFFKREEQSDFTHEVE